MEGESKATLIFGVNRIELKFEIWMKIFKEIMVLDGICSEKWANLLDIREFEVDESGEGIRVKYLYSPREIL
jgi:hypothetical protein